MQFFYLRTKSALKSTTGGNNHKKTAADRYSTTMPTTFELQQPQSSTSGKDQEKQKKPIEYEILGVDDENVYEDPMEVMQSSATEGIAYCNAAYEDMAPRETEGKGSDGIEAVYCESQYY